MSCVCSTTKSPTDGGISWPNLLTTSVCSLPQRTILVVTVPVGRRHHYLPQTIDTLDTLTLRIGETAKMEDGRARREPDFRVHSHGPIYEASEAIVSSLAQLLTLYCFHGVAVKPPSIFISECPLTFSFPRFNHDSFPFSCFSLHPGRRRASVSGRRRVRPVAGRGELIRACGQTPSLLTASGMNEASLK